MAHLAKKDYFALLGVAPSYRQNLAKIKQHYHQLQQKIHPDNFAQATTQEKQLAVEYAAIVNEAYQTLMDPLKRAIYLLKLKGIDIQAETDTAMPVEFLGEQMALREELAELSPDSPVEELEKLKDIAASKVAECEETLAGLLEDDPPRLLDARMWVRKMQFYLRLQQEITQLQGKWQARKRG